MKRVMAALASMVALSVAAFSSTIIVFLVRSEVLPALSAGSLNIQTNSRILNRVWEGNELYWLIAAHAAVVLIMAVTFMLLGRFALRGGRRQKVPGLLKTVVSNRQDRVADA